MTGGLFRKEVYQNRERRLSGEIRLSRPPSVAWFAGLLACIVAIALLALGLGSYAQKETVRGSLEPQGGVIRVQASSNGLIQSVLVSEGQRVAEGDPLIRFGAEQFLPGRFALAELLQSALRERLQRLAQQISDEQGRYEVESESLDQQLAMLAKKLENQNSQIGVYEQRLAINEELFEQFDGLADTGYQSRIEVVRQRDALLSIRQQLENARLNALNLQEQQVQLLVQQQLAPTDHRDRLHQLQQLKDDTQEQLLRLEYDRSGELRASASGTVTAVVAHPGQAASQGQTLLHLLPGETVLQAVFYAPTTSIGMIEPGQVARLRFDAFPYQRFGVFEGRISHVGKSVIMPGEVEAGLAIEEPMYRITVQLEQQQVEAYGQTYPLRPGMSLEADIITRRRSLLAWVFDPILSVKRKL